MMINRLLFQVLFYTGSWVAEKEYAPFMHELKKNIGAQKISIHRPFAKQVEKINSTETILVGHSLGGYFALQDAIKHPDKVGGVVLLNSHFNSRGVMPYCKTSIRRVSTPVLTILGVEDERLPIRKAMDDLWASIQYQHNRKFFIINKNMGHFTGITEKLDESNHIIAPIKKFINGVQSKNYTELLQMELPLKKRFEPDIQNLSKNTMMASRAANVLDAILLLTTPFPVWSFVHYLWFLGMTPDYVSHMFEDDDHILWKGFPDDEKQTDFVVQQWVDQEPYEFLNIRLPTWHVCVPIWISFPLIPYRSQNNTIIIPRIIFPINKKTTYYKIPNPRKIYKLLEKQSLNIF